MLGTFRIEVETRMGPRARARKNTQPAQNAARFENWNSPNDFLTVIFRLGSLLGATRAEVSILPFPFNIEIDSGGGSADSGRGGGEGLRGTRPLFTFLPGGRI